MDSYLYAGYQILEFSQASRESLRDIAKQLLPHKEEIITNWVRYQFNAWAPPGFSRKRLRQLYEKIAHNMLKRMEREQLEECIQDLQRIGSDLAAQGFPYEALIMSLHFLEESYLEFLLEPELENATLKLIGMDEFLHAALAAIANSYFRSYRRQLLEEVEVGRIVQESLLAEIPKAILDLDVGYTYTAAMNQGRIGGDLIDVIAVAPRKIAFIIGDLSGHGLEAAADSVMIRSIFKGFMLEEENVLAAMSRLNRVLCKELGSGAFVTVIAGMYSGDGIVELVSAGHPPAALCDNACSFLQYGGLALGIDPETTYESITTRLNADSTLLFYTDGLEEAKDGNELFGQERILRTLAKASAAPALMIANHVRDEALRFAGGRLDDDMAILVLKRRFNISDTVAQ